MVVSGERLGVRSFDFADFFVSVLRLLVLVPSSRGVGRRFDSAKKLFRRVQDEEEDDDFLLVSMLPGPGPCPGRQKPLCRWGLYAQVDRYQGASRFSSICEDMT